MSDGAKEGASFPKGVESLAYLIAVAANFRSIPPRLESSFPVLAPLTRHAALFEYVGERQTLRIDPLVASISTLLVFFGLAFLCADLAMTGPSRRIATGRIKWALVGAALALLLAAPIAHYAIARRHSDNPARYAHDGGVIATEIAGGFLAAGKNPYVESFRGTALERHVYGSRNPILDHYPYPPGNFVLAALFEPPARALLGWYDQRIVSLAAAAALLLVIARVGPGGAASRLLALALLLNPVSLSWTIEGDNDLPFLAAIVSAALFAGRGRRRAALAALAAACTLKQFGWVLAPYVLVAAIGDPLRVGPPAARVRALVSECRWFLVPALAVIAPFVAWNAGAFFEDTVLYHAGRVADPYPIGGTPGRGLSNWVLLFGLVKSNTDWFPFGILQILIAAPIAALALAGLARGDRSPAALLRACALVTLAVTLCSRSLQENYLGVVTSFLAASVLLSPRGEPPLS